GGWRQSSQDGGKKGKGGGEVEGLLGEMTRQRKLVAIGKERWSLPTAASSHDLVVGELRMHREGYGFVLPEPDSLPPRARGKLAGDIFIPPPAIGTAMHGDQVLVELGPIRQDGRAEGRILRVIERRQETVVGKFHYGSRHNYVTPIDEKVATEIVIPRGMENPREEQSRHRVLGKEAERTSAERSRPRLRTVPAGGGARAPQAFHDTDNLEGMVVEVEIVQWPSATQSPRGRVVEIVGREDDFGVDVEIIIRKHHIRHVFPEPVLEEAREIEPTIPAQEIKHRHDYRSLPIVTIDGETARDFDDAVLVSRLANGRYELHVHIADVAQYVEDGSAIDDEARRRGTSVYFPDRAVPMLPLELSTDICSLRPEVERLVLSSVMEIANQGDIAPYDLPA